MEYKMNQWSLKFEIWNSNSNLQKFELDKSGKLEFSCKISEIALKSWFSFSYVSVCDKGIVSPIDKRFVRHSWNLNYQFYPL
jgi:hypothetical protein